MYAFNCKYLGFSLDKNIFGLIKLIQMVINRIIIVVFISILPVFMTLLSSQEVVVDSLGSSTFTYSEGDSTYLMKQYFMVFLEKGEEKDQPDSLANVIQSEHLSYMDSLAQIGVIQLSGPFGDDGDVRGISIYRAPDLETTQRLASGDPAVKAGRLKVKVRPWWGAVGTTLK
jgi:uncharacterized protein YciI